MNCHKGSIGPHGVTQALIVVGGTVWVVSLEKDPKIALQGLVGG